ncbi:MAG: hypothetical protein ACREQ5_20890 [Candidatus Dormibacteria bacterium]
MNLNDVGAFLAKLNVSLAISDVVALLSGSPVSINVDPVNEPALGKTLTIALAANAVTIQFH